MLAGAFANFDTDWEAQARTLGAGPWSVWTRVTLPALAPAVAVAAAFAFPPVVESMPADASHRRGASSRCRCCCSDSSAAATKRSAPRSLVFIAPTLIVFALVARVVSDTGVRHEIQTEVDFAELRSDTGLGVMVLVAALAHGYGSPDRPAPLADDLARTDFAEIARRARGTTVRFGMWAGDEARNRFHRGRLPTPSSASSG